MKKNECIKHGELNEKTAYICKDVNAKDGFRLRCKQCVYINRARTYLANKDENIKKAAEWKKNNRERVRELARIDRQNNPEKHKKWSSDHYERNREKISLRTSVKGRGITVQQYEAMILTQDNKCALCKQEETRMARNGIDKTRLCIDHDHENGKVRELLCHDCNSALGKFKDNPELLLMAADYLIKHKGWTE